MIKTYTNINLNKSKKENESSSFFFITVGMKVKEIATGRIATVTGVYEDDNQVWMVSGNDVGFHNLDLFWESFIKVNS